MSAYHVDESSGSDTTGSGTADAPYATVAFALFTHGQDSKVLVRKDPNTPYDEPTQSALKKAKKGADGLEKKRKKAEEQAEKDAAAQGAEKEKREKLLEESKKIQLVEDTSLPEAVKVSRHKCEEIVVPVCSREGYDRYTVTLRESAASIFFVMYFFVLHYD